MSNLEQPAAFNAAVISFLASFIVMQMRTHTADHRLHTSAGLGVAVALTLMLGGMVPAAQENAADDRRSAYDQILDANVR